MVLPTTENIDYDSHYDDAVNGLAKLVVLEKLLFTTGAIEI